VNKKIEIMITENDYLKAKKVVQEYESKQLNISDVSCSYIDLIGDIALVRREKDRKWAERNGLK
jgi:hypothetical protein